MRGGPPGPRGTPWSPSVKFLIASCPAGDMVDTIKDLKCLKHLTYVAQINCSEYASDIAHFVV